MTQQISTRIQVNGLQLKGNHGVLPQETRVGNIFCYDVDIEVPWLDAADSDDIQLTISYADIVAIVREVNDTPSRLLEHLAHRLYRTLVDAYPSITAGTVKVAKITPPIAGAQMENAAVAISWK